MYMYLCLTTLDIHEYFCCCRFAHAGHIFNGMAGPVMYTAGPVISALWFPPEQRATATAISTVAGFGGNAVCFLLG